MNVKTLLANLSKKSVYMLGSLKKCLAIEAFESNARIRHGQMQKFQKAGCLNHV